MSLRPAARRIRARSTSWTVKYGLSVAAGVDLPMTAWLPITRASMMRVMTVSLSARRSELLVGVCLTLQIGRSRTAWRWLMADRRTAAPAAAHGVARRLLVFKLPDQLALCFACSVATASNPTAPLHFSINVTVPCGQRPGGFRPVAADQQSENVELAVIAQRLVQEAVRRAHAHHRDS
jgi:hypothetical protein